MCSFSLNKDFSNLSQLRPSPSPGKQQQQKKKEREVVRFQYGFLFLMSCLFLSAFHFLPNPTTFVSGKAAVGPTCIKVKIQTLINFCIEIKIFLRLQKLKINKNLSSNK